MYVNDSLLGPCGFKIICRTCWCTLEVLKVYSYFCIGASLSKPRRVECSQSTTVMVMVRLSPAHRYVYMYCTPLRYRFQWMNE